MLGRDLIEAGLSEPAGWRARLWGLCLRRPVRDRPPEKPGDDLGRLIASGGGDCGRRIRAAAVVVPTIAANPAARLIGALMVNALIPAGAIGARRRKSGVSGWPARHEVSSQKDGRNGAGGGRTPSLTMAPPQHGQRSGRRGGMASWIC